MFQAFLPMLIGAGSGLLKGMQEKKELKQQAKDLQENAARLRRTAWDARRRGAYESDLQRIKTQQDIGTQRTAQAANGGEINTDTNAMIQQDTAQFGELDALTIANNAAREAYGYEVQADQAVRNAKTLKKNAKTAVLSSVIGGAVGGIGDAYSSGAFSGLFGGGGASLQGQSKALTSNAAFVKNM